MACVSLLVTFSPDIRYQQLDSIDEFIELDWNLCLFLFNFRLQNRLHTHHKHHIILFDVFACNRFDISIFQVSVMTHSDSR